MRGRIRRLVIGLSFVLQARAFPRIDDTLADEDAARPGSLYLASSASQRGGRAPPPADGVHWRAKQAPPDSADASKNAVPLELRYHFK